MNVLSTQLDFRYGSLALALTGAAIGFGTAPAPAAAVPITNWVDQSTGNNADSLRAVALGDEDSGLITSTGSQSNPVKILDYDGSTTTALSGNPWTDSANTSDNDPTSNLSAAFAFGENDYVVGAQAGSRGTATYDGTNFSDVGTPSGRRAYEVWGDPSSNTLFVGSNSTRIYSYDGSGQTQAYDQPGGGGIISGISGSANNLWATASGGDIVRSTDDGDNFSSQASVIAATLAGTAWNDAAAATDSAAWFVGNGGVIGFWNGTSIEEQSSGTTKDLEDVVALADDSVYAVGGDGTVIHYNGSSWSDVDLGDAQTQANLFSVDADPSGNVVAVGNSGTIIRGVVPEPGSLALIGAGGLLILSRRRKAG